MEDLDGRILRQLLGDVGDYLARDGLRYSVVVVGGAALALRGWVSRTTQDVDVLALETQGELRPPEFPEALVAAIARVAHQYGLTPDWMNESIGAQWISGLPPTVGEDLVWLEFGGLKVALAGRQTLIALKLFAAVDKGLDSIHAQDLRGLKPTRRELVEARAWVVEQDLAVELPQEVDEVIRHVRHRE